MTDETSGGGRLGGQVICLVKALAIGVLVAVVAGLIGMSVYGSRCAPDDECWSLLAGIIVGMLAGAVAAAITVVVVAVRAGVGVAFGVGAAIAFLLAVAGSLTWWFRSWTPLMYFGAAVALVGGLLLSQAAGSWNRPKPVTVLLLVVILGVAAFPLVKQLTDVRQVQHDIESLVARPLQPDLPGTELWSVAYGTTGVEYLVLEPESSNGSRGADIEVVLRTLPSAPAPCTGFADRAPASAKGCTEIQPGIWRGRDAHKAHYWVRGDSGQWAHVSSTHNVGAVSLQQARDARAEQVARSLKQGSGWSLAAAAKECGFCATLA